MSDYNNMFANNTDTPAGVINFERPVGYLNINVDNGTFSFSFDGTNYINLPTGFHSFKVGMTNVLYVTATGDWQLIGVEA